MRVQVYDGTGKDSVIPTELHFQSWFWTSEDRVVLQHPTAFANDFLNEIEEGFCSLTFVDNNNVPYLVDWRKLLRKRYFPAKPSSVHRWELWFATEGS